MKKLLFFILLVLLALPVAAKEYYITEYDFTLDIPDYYVAEDTATFPEESDIVLAMTDPNTGTNLFVKVGDSQETEVDANEVIILRNNLKKYLDKHHLKPYANGITPVKPFHMGMFFYCHAGHSVDHLLFQFCAHNLIYTLESIQPPNTSKVAEFTNIVKSITCLKH